MDAKLRAQHLREIADELSPPARQYKPGEWVWHIRNKATFHISGVDPNGAWVEGTWRSGTYDCLPPTSIRPWPQVGDKVLVKGTGMAGVAVGSRLYGSGKVRLVDGEFYYCDDELEPPDWLHEPDKTIEAPDNAAKTREVVANLTLGDWCRVVMKPTDLQGAKPNDSRYAWKVGRVDMLGEPDTAALMEFCGGETWAIWGHNLIPLTQDEVIDHLWALLQERAK